MPLALTMADTLAVAFGASIVTVSLLLLYYWVIKPDRETRRQTALRAIDERRRNNWQQSRIRWAANDRITETKVPSARPPIE